MFSFLFVFLLVFHFDVLERYNIFFSCPKSLSLLFWVSFFLSFFSVTTLFYLEDSRKAHLQGVRARRSKDTKRRAPHRAGESESSLAPLFICFFFFFSPLGLSYANQAQAGALFYLTSSLQSSDLSLFYFHGLFPSLSFSHCHFGFLFVVVFLSLCSSWVLKTLFCSKFHRCFPQPYTIY